MSKKTVAFTFAIALVMQPSMASAYVGPGLGAGALAAMLGVIGSIFLAIFALLYYPIKRMIKKRKQGATAISTEDSSE